MFDQPVQSSVVITVKLCQSFGKLLKVNLVNCCLFTIENSTAQKRDKTYVEIYSSSSGNDLYEPLPVKMVQGLTWILILLLEFFFHGVALFLLWKWPAIQRKWHMTRQVIKLMSLHSPQARHGFLQSSPHWSLHSPWAQNGYLQSSIVSTFKNESNVSLLFWNSDLWL